MSAESIKQFLLGTVVPPIAGALATWLASTQVFSVFHITANAAAAEITQVLVFVVVTTITWLTSHNILKAAYSPGAKAAAAARRPPA